MTVIIEAAQPRSAEAMALLQALDQDLTGPYRPDQHHALSPDELEASNIHFFMARLDGQAVGCGAVELFDDYAEVKRMYTAPTARRAGVGRALLQKLEDVTRDAGLASLRLETGVYQESAIQLYERLGFSRCDAFGRYLDMAPHKIETSLFFEKRMT